MGSLINLYDVSVIGESPSERAALARVSSGLAQIGTELEALSVGQDRLDGELGKASDLKQDLASKIAAEAAALVAKMREGTAWALGQTGNRGTLKAYEKLSVSSIQEAIGEATRAEAAQERERLEAKKERLLVAQAGIVRETVRASLEPALLEDYAATLAHLQSGMIRLEALRRFLSPPSHDYVAGAARIAVIVPDFASGSGETAVVATAAAIRRMEAILAQFAAELERDPRAPCPSLEVDASDDADTPYHEKSAPERAQIDRDFSPQVPQHRVTTDSLLFEEQAAAKAFAALTN